MTIKVPTDGQLGVKSFGNGTIEIFQYRESFRSKHGSLKTFNEIPISHQMSKQEAIEFALLILKVAQQ